MPIHHPNQTTMSRPAVSAAIAIVALFVACATVTLGRASSSIGEVIAPGETTAARNPTVQPDQNVNDQKINYIELPARDLPAAQKFYEQAFQWSFTSYGPDYVAFTDGKLDGGFYRSQNRSTVAQGAALVILYAVDLEQTKEKVLSSGGTLVKDIFSFPGGRRFHFADPNGNELAVWSDREAE